MGTITYFMVGCFFGRSKRFVINSKHKMPLTKSVSCKNLLEKYAFWRIDSIDFTF